MLTHQEKKLLGQYFSIAACNKNRNMKEDPHIQKPAPESDFTWDEGSVVL